MTQMTDYFRPEIFEPVRTGIQAFLREVSRQGESTTETLERVFDPIDPIIKIYYKQVLGGKPISTNVVAKLVRRVTTYAIDREFAKYAFTEAEREPMRLLPVFLAAMDYTGYAVLPIKMISSDQWLSPYAELQLVSLTKLLTGPPVGTTDTMSLRGL
jgi:hypothetical protein